NPIENEDPTGDDTSSSDGGSHGFWGSIGGFFSNVWNSVSGAVGNFFSPNPGPQPTESTTTTIIYNGQVIGGGTTTRSGTSSSPPHLMILRFPLISFITVRLVPIVEAPGLMPPVLAMQLATLHWGSQDLGLE